MDRWPEQTLWNGFFLHGISRLHFFALQVQGCVIWNKTRPNVAKVCVYFPCLCKTVQEPLNLIYIKCGTSQVCEHGPNAMPKPWDRAPSRHQGPLADDSVERFVSCYNMLERYPKWLKICIIPNKPTITHTHIYIYHIIMIIISLLIYNPT